MDLIIYTDGGSLHNPGPAASAYLIYRDGSLVTSASLALGVASNNVAEYTALILALKRALELIEKVAVGTIRCYADSALMVNQLKGLYKIKHPDMKRLAAEVKELEKKLPPIIYSYIPREKNAEADALVKKALGR